MNKNETNTPSATEMLVSNMIPSTTYFDSRFETMQNQNEDLREQIGGMKKDTDRRFSEVDRRFTEMNTDMDRRFTEMNTDMDRRFTEMNTDMDRRFNEVDRRFNETHSIIEKIIMTFVNSFEI
ncbi:MAG: hypothetical protein OMM_08220 [Candidatus Magnetoglobus multicellularis str. Araruama]|uniref:t-SNARE coiled-coil homology domain-containing protein n=1 Tax=Candidatus Magnetoglobus multicellularis str. Araruama TaxID=890399 RepID=A0A1V1P8P8_9BACT|nr:MAG: hypothetical protein OMM_08220 [Candidatus Magnetoglobus multicellularis str. Araruama]